MRPTYKWTIEIEISETWVEDGFDVTDDRLHNLLMKALPWASGDEVAGRVLTRPSDERVAKAMGYPSVRAYLQARDGKLISAKSSPASSTSDK
jgi:hypothetical protein